MRRSDSLDFQSLILAQALDESTHLVDLDEACGENVKVHEQIFEFSFHVLIQFLPAELLGLLDEWSADLFGRGSVDEEDSIWFARLFIFALLPEILNEIVHKVVIWHFLPVSFPHAARRELLGDFGRVGLVVYELGRRFRLLCILLNVFLRFGGPLLLFAIGRSIFGFVFLN